MVCLLPLDRGVAGGCIDLSTVRSLLGSWPDHGVSRFFALPEGPESVGRCEGSRRRAGKGGDERRWSALIEPGAGPGGDELGSGGPGGGSSHAALSLGADRSPLRAVGGAHVGVRRARVVPPEVGVHRLRHDEVG